MAVTYKAIIIPNNRRKDGTYPVKIRVTFKGVSRRLATNLVCYPEDLTRTHRIKNNTILDKADVLIRQMRTVTDGISPFDLEQRDVDWVVTKIKDKLTEESFHLDFFEWCDKYVLTKNGTTRNAYTCALNTFERFIGERRLDINEITRSMLIDFMEMVDNDPKMYYDQKLKKLVKSKKEKIPLAASTRHLSKLQHMFKAAKTKYNDEDAGKILIPRSPFDKIEKHYVESQGQSSIGFELMQRMISYQADNKVMRTALDLFIVSFGLMGANMADMYYAKPFKVDWVYNRQKTKTRRSDKAKIKVEIPDQLKPYIERLEGGKGGWWLNGLHEFASSKDFATDRVNRCLRRWCKELGVEEFTFYAARHTWASIARNNAKIEKALIDECLCHKGDFAMADTYIDKDFSLLKEANAKVLDLFEW